MGMTETVDQMRRGSIALGGRRPGVTNGLALGLVASTVFLSLTLLSPATVRAQGVSTSQSTVTQAAAVVAEAAMRGDIESVRGAIAAGEDVNAALGDGMTGLHWAAERGDAPLARLLMEAGAEVDRVRLGGYTPLHLASSGANALVLGVLLAAGADPDRASTAGGATPLHFAARTGDVSAVRALITGGATVDAVEEAQGQTPLIFAAAANRVEAVQALLEAGADPTVATKVVNMAARDAAMRVQRQARNAAARGQTPPPSATGPPSSPPTTGRGGTASTPAPAQAPQEGEPRRSMSYTELIGGIGGFTALVHAAREGHIETVRALVAGGAPVDQVSGGDHSSPMLIATINGHFDLALVLLEAGADPTLASDAGTTPLYASLNVHWAPKARYPQPGAQKQQDAGYLEFMRTMLEAGADPNASLNRHLWYMGYNFDLLGVNTTGATAFWRAAYATDVAAMRLLVEYGADPTLSTIKLAGGRGGGRGGSALDPSGLPPVAAGAAAVMPIHAASGVGYGQGYAGNSHRHVPESWLSAIRYLVEEHGADVNARDDNGYTALHHAAARGDNELILYLVEQGADVTVVSRRGQTTVDMANGPVQRITPFPTTISLLEKLGAKNNHNCVGC